MVVAITNKRSKYQGKNRVSRTASIPAPTGGWNQRDSLAGMPALDAHVLSNWFPSTTDVQLRKGYDQWATGLPSTVLSIMEYAPQSGSDELFAAVQTGIYDVTSTGAAGAAVVSGTTSGKWQHLNFSTPGGNFLLCVNGTDTSQIYNGSTWGNLTYTGVAMTDVINITAFKERVWLVEKDTMSVWYSAVNSISGALTEFNLGSLFSLGGSLTAMCSWTHDAGDGIDDYAAFVTSNGEVAVYQGTDPASASTWALVGVYRIAEPLSRRCWIKFGGDVLLLTKTGVYPLSRALKTGRINELDAVTDKIRNAFTKAAGLYAANFGWEIMLFPEENMLICNIPVADGSNQQQYVMNTITGAWCKFEEWEANCWGYLNGEIYFGGATTVNKAWQGTDDNGVAIFGDAEPAYNYFGQGSAQKRWTMARPIYNSTGNPEILIRLNTNFTLQEPTGVLTPSPVVYGIWDSAVWDTGIWGGEFNNYEGWRSVEGIGYAATLHFEVLTSDSTCNWVSTDYVFEYGDIL